MAQAHAAVTGFTASLERMYPERLTSKGRPVRVFPAQAVQFRGAEMDSAARVLSSITGGLVLLIACVNVAGLLMARRRRTTAEIAVRVAIGAGRTRVVQAMLVESLLLVLAGSVLGLLLAVAINWAPFPSEMGPLRNAMALDGRILPYAIPFVLLTTLVCGVLPALRATRKNVVDHVRQSGDGVTPRTWMRQMLVVGQWRCRCFWLWQRCSSSAAKSGSDRPTSVLISTTASSRGSVSTSGNIPETRVHNLPRLVERIAQIPAVSAVSEANLVPLGGDSLLRSFHPAGRTDIPGTRPSIYSVGPAFSRRWVSRCSKGVSSIAPTGLIAASCDRERDLRQDLLPTSGGDRTRADRGRVRRGSDRSGARPSHRHDRRGTTVGHLLRSRSVRER